MADSGTFERSTKLVSAVLAIAAFAWGVYTYRHTAELKLAQQEAEARRTAETRRIEATQPFLQMQLALYTEATVIAAKIANSDNKEEVAAATRRFHELYWGELALVERNAVAAAMVAFRDALQANAPQTALQPLSLDLAHACRDELAASWGTDAWKR